MTKLILKPGVLWAALFASAAAAQEGGATTSAEPASPIVVVLFVLLFVGVIALFFVWMIRSGKRGEADGADPVAASLESNRESSDKPRT